MRGWRTQVTLALSSSDRWEVRITHWTEWWGNGHQYYDYHIQYSSDWCSQWDTWEGTPKEKAMGHQRCFRPLWWEERFEEEAVWRRRSKRYREANRRLQKAVKKAKEDWLGAQCEKIKTRLNNNNSKRRAYQLMKYLTSEKQGRSSTIQVKSRKCLTEETEILSRWTEYCSKMYMRVMETTQYWTAANPGRRSATNAPWGSWDCSSITEKGAVCRSW